MHYFVYLARLHEPLAERVKNLVSAAKSLSSSHRRRFRGGLAPGSQSRSIWAYRRSALVAADSDL